MASVADTAASYLYTGTSDVTHRTMETVRQLWLRQRQMIQAGHR